MKRGSLVAIVMALLVAFSLSGCGLIPDPSIAARSQCGTQTEQGNTMNNETTSRLDEAGLKEIHATCLVTFDLSNGVLLKQDLGVGIRSGVPEIATDGPVTLRLLGAKGNLEARTDRIRFFTMPEMPEVGAITYFLAVDTPEELFSLVREGVDAYGFDRARAERWVRDTRASLDEVDAYSYVVGEGYAPGFYVSYDVKYKGLGHVSVITVTVDPSADKSR